MAVLKQSNASQLLIRHLTIVHNTACLLMEELLKNCPSLVFNKEEIAFGAATHDIGKTIETKELYEKGGKRHEAAGYELLLKSGLPENLARFAKTHGNWTGADIKIEDLIVAQSDKIWKGKRIDDLEEALAKAISEAAQVDYWEVYTQLDMILSGLALGADGRIRWQNELK